MPAATQSFRCDFDAYPSPWWRALVAQASGLIVAVLLGALWSALFGAAIQTLPWIMLLSLGAAAATAMLGMAWWWIALNAALAPALAIGVAASLSPHWSGAALLMLLLMYGGTLRTRVPLYLSNAAAVRALRDLLPTDRPLSFLDLGAGTGTMLAAISTSHPNVAVNGVERAPLPFFLAFFRARVWGQCYRICWGNLWSTDLSGHDVVYAYLSPAPMSSLWDKARREMRPGSLLVSFRFKISGVVPERTIGAGANCLYVWRLP